MKTKTDMRIVKSKLAIKNAFLQLIKENGYANITITDIANRAMINRKTFYMHYETKEILYKSIINEFMDLLSPAFDHLQKLKGRKAQRQYVLSILMKLKENKEIYNILINDKTTTLFYDMLKSKLNYDLINKSHIDEKTKDTKFTSELLCDAYFSLFLTLANWWVNTADDISPDDVIDLMIDFFSRKTLEIIGITFDDNE